ncbi:hypothetical protein NQ318_017565 [Aromia moschata]|uniref:MRG-binding protein n=1 Tax=Aromia moschata TaxID=1265417 RepID=A0AAV8Z212_9CUCU|nr:hypothetical protein NQ318_017565 [Aromia moschata]
MDDFEWNVVNEGQLLDAMVGHKPVGVNKYFQMAFICDKFTDNLHKDIDPEKIWAHLETMYNLEALDESESIPFPNGEREFNLPEADFGNLINKKDEEKNKSQPQKGGRETPKLVKETKKDEKTPVRNQKDNKEGKDVNKTPAVAKKEIKKEVEKTKAPVKGRNSIGTPKEENKSGKSKSDDTPKPAKRPYQGQPEAERRLRVQRQVQSRHRHTDQRETKEDLREVFLSPFYTYISDQKLIFIVIVSVRLMQCLIFRM